MSVLHQTHCAPNHTTSLNHLPYVIGTFSNNDVPGDTDKGDNGAPRSPEPLPAAKKKKKSARSPRVTAIILSPGSIDSSLDGLDDESEGHGVPNLPTGRNGIIPTLILSKKSVLKQKKAEGVAARMAAVGQKRKPAPKTAASKKAVKKKPAKDSEDDNSDDSSSESEFSSDDGSVLAPAAAAPVKKKPRVSTPVGSGVRAPKSKPAIQTTLLAKVKLSEIPETAPELSAIACNPALTMKNGGTRFVLVPASQFQVKGIGGWIAKIVKITRNKDQTTELQFKDRDGKMTREYFKFSHVLAHFKPLT